MAPREDVISSAVAFLQDPSVAASALDKRIAFLRSKNLTQEEIDISLARAGNDSQPTNISPPPLPPSNQYRSTQGPPPGYGYNYGYNGYPPWTQQPPEPPQRDWRDWFIMATVTTGLGYGLYNIAQRYIIPHLAPPTPPQLTQDKASIDASFNKAFALIDQLSTDTATLKSAELERTSKLDSALKETESLLAEVRAANARREGENRILVAEVQGLRELVPKSLEQWKKGDEGRLEEIAAEVGGLKRLVENRVGRSSQQQVPGFASTTPASSQVQQPQTRGNGPVSESGGDSSTGQKASQKEASPQRRAGGNGGKAAIPAWQMAFANKDSGSSGSASNSRGNAEIVNGDSAVEGNA